MRETVKRVATAGALLTAIGGGILAGHFEGKNEGMTACGEQLSPKDYGHATLTDAERMDFSNHNGDQAFYDRRYPDLAKVLGGTTTAKLVDVVVFHSDNPQLNRERVAAAYPLSDTLHKLAPNILDMRFSYDQTGEPGVAATINASSIGC